MRWPAHIIIRSGRAMVFGNLQKEVEYGVKHYKIV